MSCYSADTIKMRAAPRVDNVIGHREHVALRLAEQHEGILYVGGYGMLFEAAMVCESLGLLKQGDRASRLELTLKGRAVLFKAGPGLKPDGWTLEVA